MADVDAPPLTSEEQQALAAQYAAVTQRVGTAAAACPSNVASLRPPHGVRLVAVSKTQPWPVLRAVYDAGCRHFGENYVQEITAKAPRLPADLHWHFVGHLQSNKCKELLSAVPSLDVVESVDSEKLATKLNDAVAKYREGRRLGVFVQVNTSGEESKSGVEPAAAADLAAFIAAQCPLLEVRGLMTIGMPDYTSRPENFACLLACRAEVAARLGVVPSALDLSMGMSGDFENAIAMGSSNVRVGTSIFGARKYPISTDKIPTPPPEEAAAVGQVDAQVSTQSQ